MKKSELRAMIREMLHEELATQSILTEGYGTPEESLLATHICKDSRFESACLSGNADMIMAIVDEAIENNDMHTAGATKLRQDIYRMTRGNRKIPSKVGENILFFVWNSQLSGTGNAVIKAG